MAGELDPVGENNRTFPSSPYCAENPADGRGGRVPEKRRYGRRPRIGGFGEPAPGNAEGSSQSSSSSRVNPTFRVTW